MSESYQHILEVVAELRRQWRVWEVSAGCLLAAAAAAAALTLAVAFDNLFAPPTAGRTLLAVALWAAVLAGVARFVVRRWRADRRDDYFAALIEQKHPEIRNLLVNGLQLGRDDRYGSPRLIEAIVKDAAGAAGTVELEACLDRRPLRQASAFALAGALIVAGYASLFGARFANGLARVLRPAAPIAPYTATRVRDEGITPGHARVPEGADVLVRAAVSGVVPDSARLFSRVDRKPWQSRAMPPATNGTDAFEGTLPDVRESFDYYVAAGDGRSRTFRVEVVKRPRLSGLSLRYTPPSYTGLGARDVTNSSGDVEGVAGTTVALRLAASKPLREAALVTDGDPPLVLAWDKAGAAIDWTAAFVIWGRGLDTSADVPGRRVPSPARYQLRLLDTDGYDNADPVWHPVTAIRDQPPTVAITAPGRDLQVKADETVNLAVSGRDDYGLGPIRLLARINEESTPRELTVFRHDGPPETETRDAFAWSLAGAGLKPGDRAQYWAVAADRNTITGPGSAESRRFSLFVVSEEEVGARVQAQEGDYAQVLEELLRMQRENRAQTASGAGFDTLVKRQARIRNLTGRLARAMEDGAVPLRTMVQDLDALRGGLMVEAIRLLEGGRDAADPAQADACRAQSLPVQDRIAEALQALLARLQRNEQAREALRRIEKTDKPSHKVITETLSAMVKDLARMTDEQKDLAAEFEKLPKRPVEELSGESLETVKGMDEFMQRWAKWAEGKVDELTKLPTGFVDDFGLRPDVKRIFEDIEKAAARRKAEKVEVAIEDMGVSLATKMKEDLAVWMPDTPDFYKWIQEEPLGNRPLEIPEMPLPDGLEDMMGELLQQAEEFDEEADDVTSAWGDNLDQAGWGVSDGPISSFSAKGVTGNDLPNTQEVGGRSGDGRRGKSSGQMVGDTARALPGRDTPARVTAERYEPGVLKQTGQADPQGATGGGKKAGAGPKGLQGSTPPDFVRDMERLSAEQAAIREKTERIANKLDAAGIRSRRLQESIALMRSVEQDYRDLRYEDAARKRRVSLGLLDGALTDVNETTAVQLSRARQLPAALRDELLQAADEAYPPGYEDLLRGYFRALSEAESK